MPDETKDTTAAESAATDADETGGTQEPQKIVIEGLGEFTPEQIRAMKKAKDDEPSLLRALNEAGFVKNDLKRRLDETTAEYNQRLKEIEEKIERPAKPRGKWREASDADEKMNLFFEEISDTVHGIESKQRQFSQDLTAKEKARMRQAEDAQYTAIADDTLDRMGAPDDVRARQLIQGHIAIEVGAVDRRQWTPELFRDAAKNALEAFNDIKKSGQSELIEKVKADKKIKTGSPGTAPAPDKKKLVPGMDKAERNKILFEHAPE